MAEKITRTWIKELLVTAQTLATKFGLTTVAQNLGSTIDNLKTTAIKYIRASNFDSFNAAMNAFSTNEYLSQTNNEQYETEDKKIKYTIFSGKKGDLISSAIKQSLDAAAESWSNIKCVYSYTCQQGLCPNDQVTGSYQVNCSYETCKQGYADCNQGTYPNSKNERRVCNKDSKYPSCNNYVYYELVNCPNGLCKKNGTKWCNGNESLTPRTCTKKREVPIIQECSYGACSQGTIYDIRCNKITEAEE